MFRPKKLFEKRRISPARLSARQALEAIPEIAAGTTPYASFEYYVQQVQAIELLAERVLGQQA